MPLFLMYNTGNSGGSWMGDVISSHPKCTAMEEPRRKLDLPKVGPDFTMQQLQATLFNVLRKHEREGEAFGFIKGFREEILEYVLDKGGTVTQQTRHPVRVLHGTRKRTIKARSYWGRAPKNEIEQFQGHVRHMAGRYRAFIDRSDQFRLFRLEDLMVSLYGPRQYFAYVLELVTQIEWTKEDIERAAQVRPRHRLNAPADRLWDFDYEENSRLTWDKRRDPPVSAIWEHWEGWQKAEFSEQFGGICRHLRYSTPEG